jgi:hypothetical protein
MVYAENLKWASKPVKQASQAGAVRWFGAIFLHSKEDL